MQPYFNTQNVEVSNEVNLILDRLDDTCGFENVKKELKKYAQFLELKKNKKISIGNNNVLINCKNQFINIELILDAIRDILRVYIGEDVNYEYIEARVNRGSEHIKVFECNRINPRNDYENDRTLRIFNDNLDNTLIFLFRDKYKALDFYEEIITNNLAYWEIEIEATNLNANYIIGLLKENNLEIDKRCRLFNLLDSCSYSDINHEIFELILECKINGITIITDNALDKLNLFKKPKAQNTEVKKDKKPSGYQDLNNMIGLESVKEQVRKIVNYVKIARQRGATTTLHMAFEGNPGTGKTEVSRAIGKIFSEERILSDDEVFVEATRVDLVGEYIRTHRTQS